MRCLVSIVLPLSKAVIAVLLLWEIVWILEQLSKCIDLSDR